MTSRTRGIVCGLAGLLLAAPAVAVEHFGFADIAYIEADFDANGERDADGFAVELALPIGPDGPVDAPVPSPALAGDHEEGDGKALDAVPAGAGRGEGAGAPSPERAQRKRRGEGAPGAPADGPGQRDGGGGAAAKRVKQENPKQENGD